MTLTLFEILNEEELHRLKFIGLTRNVRIKDLTIEELGELKEVFWPGQGSIMNLMDVITQLSRRKAL